LRQSMAAAAGWDLSEHFNLVPRRPARLLVGCSLETTHDQDNNNDGQHQQTDKCPRRNANCNDGEGSSPTLKRAAIIMVAVGGAPRPSSPPSRSPYELGVRLPPFRPIGCADPPPPPPPMLAHSIGITSGRPEARRRPTVGRPKSSRGPHSRPTGSPPPRRTVST
jgi:hypothetical protein